MTKSHTEKLAISLKPFDKITTVGIFYAILKNIDDGLRSNGEFLSEIVERVSKLAKLAEKEGLNFSNNESQHVEIDVPKTVTMGLYGSSTNPVRPLVKFGSVRMSKK